MTDKQLYIAAVERADGEPMLGTGKRKFECEPMPYDDAIAWTKAWTEDDGPIDFRYAGIRMAPEK